MKVGLLTFINTNNYGAMLQGYATTRFLEQNGHEVVVINVPLLNPGKGEPLTFLQKINSKFASLYLKFIRATIPGENRRQAEKRRDLRNQDIAKRAKEYDHSNMRYFDEFRRKFLPNITATKYYYDKDFNDDFNDVDLFVVGSDQVWNLWVTNEQFGVFFFSFLNKTNKKRISYAASFGGSTRWPYSQYKTETIQSLLSQFNSIAVRDRESKYILNNILKFKGDEVLDPTFLLDNYDELLQESDLDAKGSLFSFKFIINDYWANTIKFMAKELNLSVRMDSCLIPFDGLNFKPSCSVIEWIRLIKTSDFVFTDSFHGMVFCILFKKQFLVTPSYAHGEGRYFDLAQKLGLEDRLYTSTQEIYKAKDIWIKPIDYDKVYEKVEKLRSSSREFLLSHLT